MISLSGPQSRKIGNHCVREELFRINVAMLKCLALNLGIYACFIFFQAVVDKVEYDKLVDIFKAKNIANRDGILLNARKSECKLLMFWSSVRVAYNFEALNNIV